MKLRPTSDNVFMKILEEKETKSGIILPDSVSEFGRAIKCEVIAVGNGKYSEKTAVLLPMEVKVGDIVLASRFLKENPIRVGNDSYYLAEQKEIYAIIE